MNDGKPYLKEEKKGLRVGRKDYMMEGRKKGHYIGRTTDGKTT